MRRAPAYGSPALTPGEAVILPTLLGTLEVAKLLGYADPKSAKRWLKKKHIDAHENCGNRKWPRAAIIAALGVAGGRA